MAEIMVPVIYLKQPWAWWLVHGHEHPNGKRVENRTWALPAWLYGERCIIGASKSPCLLRDGKGMGAKMGDAFCDAWDIAGLAGARPPLFGRHANSSGVGDLLWDEVVSAMRFGGLIGAVQWHNCIAWEAASRRPSEWADAGGTYWWTTADAKPLPFVPWRGQQGFFQVPLSELPAEYQKVFATEGTER